MSSIWNSLQTGTSAGAYGSIGGVFGTPIVAAPSILMTAPMHVVTGTATLSTINGGLEGKLYFLVAKDGFATDIAGNLGTATQVPAGSVLSLLYDGTKYRQVQIAGITSFNGRDGAVESMATDYATFYPSLADFTVLQTAVSGKASAIHSHVQSDVIGLSTALAAKANSSHSHAQSDITNLVAELAAKASASHTHAQSDITSLATDLAAKASVASPAFSGIPTTPTAAAGTNTTQIASCGFVQTGLAGKANASHTHAQVDIVNLTTDLAAKAPVVSPAFSGVPTAPTAATGTNTTQIATTAFVLSSVAAISTGVTSFNGRTGAVAPQLADYDSFFLTQGEGDARYVLLTGSTFSGAVKFGTDANAASLAKVLFGSKAWDPVDVASGASTSTLITVTGAALGDFIVATFNINLTDGLWLSGRVQSANTVNVTLFNLSGTNANLTNGTLSVLVIKAT